MLKIIILSLHYEIIDLGVVKILGPNNPGTIEIMNDCFDLRYTYWLSYSFQNLFSKHYVFLGSIIGPDIFILRKNIIGVGNGN